MGIGWLWHYTRSGGTDGLREDNEARAAAFYGRWRTVYVLLENFARRALDRRCDARRRRIGLRELDALSDHLLDDIGLRLDGTGRLVGTSKARVEDAQRAFGDVVLPLAPTPGPCGADAPARCAEPDGPSRRHAA